MESDKCPFYFTFRPKLLKVHELNRFNMILVQNMGVYNFTSKSIISFEISMKFKT